MGKDTTIFNTHTSNNHVNTNQDLIMKAVTNAQEERQHRASDLSSVTT
jgi:hypothetical protein